MWNPTPASAHVNAAPSTLERRLAAYARSSRERTAAHRFETDLRTLETRVTVIDARFRRLAERDDTAYRMWRDDTVGRMQALARAASAYTGAGLFAAGDGRRVHGVLSRVRDAVGRLDRRHAEYLASLAAADSGAAADAALAASTPARAAEPAAPAARPAASAPARETAPPAMGGAVPVPVQRAV
ncbi:hypothetical protein [Agromyces archimandritae]|uniref:Uncharacterized protein n=1 Tax=Agromyces archimandritae TaxID=2781962 RepID=A0A975FNE6_9MICO|nr:hypothetical protein [Agromyces archimandritae]QTX05625.1 hypothetical protein G127AT_05315 [Agromyces archimandritae]